MKTYYITEKAGHSFELHPTYHSIQTQSFIPYQFVTHVHEVLFFDIENESAQTHVDLSHFAYYILMGLDGKYSLSFD